jgi:biopolymer transport protein ExbB/TolQ
MLENVNQYADLIWYVIVGFVAVATAVLGWTQWSLQQTFVTRKELDEKIDTVEKNQQAAIDGLNKSIAAMNSRVALLDGALKTLPTAADMQHVLLAMEEARGALKEQSARLDGMAAEQVARLDGMGDVLSGVSSRVEMLFAYHIKEK